VLAELVEDGVRDHERLHVRERRDGRRSQLARERRHLAERGARPERPEELLVALPRQERHLHLAREQDEHVRPRLELREDAHPVRPAGAP